MSKRRRNEFSKQTMRDAFARSGGRCESALVPSLENIGCNRALRSGDINYDHISAEAISHDNSLANCSVLCRSCHAIKTGKHDVPAIAQDKRVHDLAIGIHRPRRPLPGGRSDPFYFTPGSTTPIDRKTGLPWRGSQ
jgi:hypothetical protein